MCKSSACNAALSAFQTRQHDVDFAQLLAKSSSSCADFSAFLLSCLQEAVRCPCSCRALLTDPLHHAEPGMVPSCIRSLYQTGHVDLNADLGFGWTALHWACRHGYVGKARQLLAFGSDHTRITSAYASELYVHDKWTVFVTLGTAGHDDVAMDMMKLCLDEATPLAVAAAFGQIGSLRLLKHQAPCITKHNAQGWATDQIALVSPCCNMLQLMDMLPSGRATLHLTSLSSGFADVIRCMPLVDEWLPSTRHIRQRKALLSNALLIANDAETRFTPDTDVLDDWTKFPETIRQQILSNLTSSSLLRMLTVSKTCRQDALVTLRKRPHRFPSNASRSVRISVIPLLKLPLSWLYWSRPADGPVRVASLPVARPALQATMDAEALVSERESLVQDIELDGSAFDKLSRDELLMLLLVTGGVAKAISPMEWECTPMNYYQRCAPVIELPTTVRAGWLWRTTVTVTVVFNSLSNDMWTVQDLHPVVRSTFNGKRQIEELDSLGK
eukprot:m.46980 g.46980  ORF g.46980 m.46980 type:complete len:500 (+) comp13188_c0_seq1:28-1527(+)